MGERLKMLKCPGHYTPSGKELMSNFDHVIDRGVEELLRSKPVYAKYPARNFCGVVWYSGEAFHCEIWRYKTHIETVSAPTPELLHEAICEEFGSE